MNEIYFVILLLRKHLTLNSSVLDQLIKIDFSVIKREEILTEEAWISLTVESIVGMSSRS